VLGEQVGRRILGRARDLGEFARFAWRLLQPALASAGAAWRGRPGARRRRLARLSHVPLPNLHDLHPEAARLPRRELGIRSIPLDRIAGTAVAGPNQRGADFKPLPAFRSKNWLGRMQRVRAALNDLATLPPIDVVRYGDRYWVEDGHNRVAAGLELGQIEVDAAVTDLVRPGAAPSPVPTSLAAVLSEGADLRAAGAGRRSSTVGESTAWETPLTTADPAEAGAPAGRTDEARPEDGGLAGPARRREPVIDPPRT
jgi:hypothetical protein